MRSSRRAASGKAFEHVPVGGEVGAVGEDRAGPGVEHGGGELVEVDGGGVAGDHLARLGTEDTVREQVADAFGKVDPLVPAGDEVGAPLGGQRAQPLARGDRQPSERVAVEIDGLGVVDDEALAKRRQRIGGVQALGVRALDHCSSSQSVTARQAVEEGSRCSMWPTPASATSRQGSPASAARSA